MNLIESRRLRVPEVFRAGRRLYLSYRPDWDYDFNGLSEMRDLSQRWVQGNEANNLGDASRLCALVPDLSQVISKGISRDLAELGVHRGNSAAVLAHYAEKADHLLYLFDTFSGFNRETSSESTDATSIDAVKMTVGSDRAIYVSGSSPGTATPEISDRRFAIAHLDCDLYEPMKAGREFFYSRLSTGGLIMMHDYSIRTGQERNKRSTNSARRFRKASSCFLIKPERQCSASPRQQASGPSEGTSLNALGP